ncbi:MAG: outer membrane beta-barrel protein [Acidobacteriota bacterium]|jgi:opacity protein-like surface antigen|nr:MAG: hypothetical protein DIU54_09320 [Acidobacteriota bacterium]
MRRAAVLGALVTILALPASQVSAQTATPGVDHVRPWHVNATIGPSFGTVGTAPTTMASAGYELGNGWSLVGEAGTFRGKPLEFETVIPGATGPAVDDSQRANAFHYNVNVYYQVPERARLLPYLTAGVGAFNTMMVDEPIPGLGSIATLDRVTHAASNLGGGLTYRLSDWLGLTADYRLFVFNTNEAQRVNRFTTGVSILLR